MLVLKKILYLFMYAWAKTCANGDAVLQSQETHEVLSTNPT